MTNVEFIRLFRNPALLAAADVADLERLTGKYPYSANAQLLLAMWAEMSGHPQRERYFQRAAATTFDRAHLYDLLQEMNATGATQSPLVQEEEFELFQLEDLDSLDAPEPLPAYPIPDALDDFMVNPGDRGSYLAENFGPGPEAYPADQMTDTDPAQNKVEVPLTVDPDPHSSEANSTSSTTESSTPEDDPEPSPPTAPEPPNPAPAAAPEIDAIAAREEPEELPTTPEDPKKFLHRYPISSREELVERLRIIRRRQVEGAKQQKQSVKKIAHRSLVASDGMISATLAEVFINQKQYQHAIRIYEQLALANPEKRPIFAALIKDLKRKL